MKYGPEQPGQWKRGWREKIKVGVEPAWVCRITDGRLASRGEPASLRSFNLASRCTPLSSITQSLASPGSGHAGCLAVCVCVTLQLSRWAVISACSIRTDEWSPVILEDAGKIKQPANTNARITNPPTHVKPKVWNCKHKQLLCAAVEIRG